MKLLSAGAASDFALWVSLRSAFSQPTISKRKRALNEYLQNLKASSDFQLEFAMQRISQMKNSLSGEDWLLSERLSSDLFQEMSARDVAEELALKEGSKTQGLAVVIDLEERRKSLLDT